ncbi:MAG TPA: 1,6-anhydro-N-acetylmuramyl-L-alanine amidase AmpD [Gammaproteobacteria bacterium]|nr:1,6-anhydro-N-acetylmuramyl-L-alanine amidase AmpD [Gammaproteobacteria bacterium]
MHVDTASGLLVGVRQVASPNQNARPTGTAIDLLVIHGISLPAGRFGGPFVEQLFTNTLDVSADAGFQELAELRVSSHLFIDRKGHVTQFVPFHRRAWHAGKSRFEGRENCNDFSIGIELEGTDALPYEDVQYTQLIAVCRALREVWPALEGAHIVGHSDIAPGRKTDPGPAFDWPRLRNGLNYQ